MLQLGRISFSFGGNAMFCEEEIRSRSEKDALIIDEAWRSLEKRLTEMSDAKTAEKITAAFRDYYGEVYHPDLVLWLANLYDAESGGFYYSNYAKDNDTGHIIGALMTTWCGAGDLAKRLLYGEKGKWIHTDQIADTIDKIFTKEK